MITACLVACGCMGDDPGSPREPLTPATATIEDMLAVDGCSIVVTVDGTEYAPDAHTRTTIRSRMLPMLATVDIRYRVTGGTGTIVCEAGSFDRPEITFVFDD